MARAYSAGARALLCALPLVLCSACVPSVREPTTEQWAKVHRDVDEILSVEKAFSRDHKFVGESIGRATAQLKNEGFSCFVERKSFPTSDAAAGNLEFAEKSVVYCSRPRREDKNGTCEVIWASFHVRWQDPVRPGLESETGARSLVEREQYFCKPTRNAAGATVG